MSECPRRDTGVCVHVYLSAVAELQRFWLFPITAVCVSAFEPCKCISATEPHLQFTAASLAHCPHLCLLVLLSFFVFLCALFWPAAIVSI